MILGDHMCKCGSTPRLIVGFRSRSIYNVVRVFALISVTYSFLVFEQVSSAAVERVLS